MKRLPVLAIGAAGLAALSLGLSACGGNSSSASSTTTAAPATTAPATTAPATTAGGATAAKALTLDADPNGALAYVQTTLSAPSGAVDIKFTNDSSVPHDVSIEGKGTSTIISGGATTDLKISNLPPGTYTYFCTVPGHEQAGMKGTLTVS